ncbi:MAG: tyrosine-type recombinase/integrase [Alphaproteobacteria bacterium]|nr:tyrosine-type recombinase/integrase [Alphaproteobacteria bacterium]
MVPMPAAAARVLRGLARTPNNPFVFPGRKKGTRLHNLNDSWDRVRSRAKLDGVRLHDLRHTYASRALALGHTLPMIGDLLGHRMVSTTSRYAHLERNAVREAAADVAGNIAHMSSRHE